MLHLLQMYIYPFVELRFDSCLSRKRNLKTPVSSHGKNVINHVWQFIMGKKSSTIHLTIISFLQQVRFDDAGEKVFLIWPAIIAHEIDETSPFYNMSAQDILSDTYELVVALEGTIESTGQSIQARTSFVPTEILWGHRFEQMVMYQKETGEFLVDYR